MCADPVKGREWGWWGAAMGQRRDVVKGLEMGGGTLPHPSVSRVSTGGLTRRPRVRVRERDVRIETETERKRNLKLLCCRR